VPRLTRHEPDPTRRARACRRAFDKTRIHLRPARRPPAPRAAPHAAVGSGGLVAGHELDGALAGDEVVVEHAAEGNHGEAAVLELGQLAAGEGVRVLGLPVEKGRAIRCWEST
jgi:hypothetical protein